LDVHQGTETQSKHQNIIQEKTYFEPGWSYYSSVWRYHIDIYKTVPLLKRILLVLLISVRKLLTIWHDYFTGVYLGDCTFIIITV